MLSFLFCMKLCYFSVSYINTILQEIYIQLSLDLEFNVMLKKIFGAPRPNKTMLKKFLRSAQTKQYVRQFRAVTKSISIKYRGEFFLTINQCILFLTMQAFLQFVLGGPRRFSDTTLSPLFVQSIKGHKT